MWEGEEEFQRSTLAFCSPVAYAEDVSYSKHRTIQFILTLVVIQFLFLLKSQLSGQLYFFFSFSY
jgi:hypothetical protein